MDRRKIVGACAIAALMTLAVVTAGCTTNTGPAPTRKPFTQTATITGNNTTVTSDAGFQITLPSKYNYTWDGSTPIQFYLYLDPNNTATGVNIGASAQPANATLGSMSDYYYGRLLDQHYQNFTVVSQSNGTLAGKPAQTLTFKGLIPVQYSQSERRDQQLQVQEIWMLNNNTGYTVVYKAPPNDFTKFLPEAQKIINSLQLR
ncbi:MAG: hypothetical protein ACXVIF_04210 [Halobacteriota archaeon]